jgi:hypothetical protein
MNLAKERIQERVEEGGASERGEKKNGERKNRGHACGLSRGGGR